MWIANQRRDLMEIIEERHGGSSTLITSQLPVEAWHEVIGEPTFADAILDRCLPPSSSAEAEPQSALAIPTSAKPAKEDRK